MYFLFKLKHPTLPSCLLSTALAVSCNTVFAESNPIAFGDSSQTIEMSDEWKARAISHDATLNEADLVVSLGQITYPALRKFVDDYAKKKGIKIIIQPGSCGVTAKKISQKVIDVGAYCCPPGKTDRLPGVQFHTIGISSIALIVNPANKLSGLSLSDARKIFSGNVMKWSEVPTEKLSKNKIIPPINRIQPVARLHCKKRPGHWRHLLKSDDMFSPHVQEVGVIPDMVKEVAEKKSAIGFETTYMLEVYKKQGEVKTLTINGHSPDDLQKLLSAEYPFYRVFSLTTWTGSDKANKLSEELVASIKKHIEMEGDKYGMISSKKLRMAGWKFKGDELVGEPDGKNVFSEHQ